MIESEKTYASILAFIHFIRAKYRGFLQSTLLMVVTLVIFESAQQYYYVLQFDLSPSSQLSIFDLALAHAYRWVVWLILSLIYFGMLVYKGQFDQAFTITKVTTAIQHLMLLIAINVVIISLLQLTFSGRVFSVENIWDNCVFFFFQKAPIYTLAHGAMLGIFQLVNSNQNLAIKILDLKNQNITKNTQALSIKIGNKSKIIPLADILWIEAYDYCVKIHTVDEHSYAMRNSLKALEKKLQDRQFLRVHRKAIVNMNRVSQVTYNSSSFLTLENQAKIDIAQSRIVDIKAFLKSAG